MQIIDKTERPMLEELIFQVDPKFQDEFLKADYEIWTHFLEQQEGFLEKQVWVSADYPDQITHIIYWKNMQVWKQIPSQTLLEVEKRFETVFKEKQVLIKAGHEENQRSCAMICRKGEED